jgi:hypothetical protein
VKYTAQQIENLLQGVFDGKYTNKNLPEDLYFAIADHLKEGLYTGYGSTIEIATGRDLRMLTELRENVYMFSGAKTYSQVIQMRDFAADANGFKEFRDKALEVYDMYNKTWLQTEYDTTIGQAQCAVKWTEFEKNKEVLPNLRYSAIGDACDICAPLNNIVAPVDAAIWSTCAPLNHFNCLCLLEATEDETTSGYDEIAEKVEGRMQDIFKMNPGKDGYIFKDDHPYFKVAPGDRGLAMLNFNLPIPEND